MFICHFLKYNRFNLLTELMLANLNRISQHLDIKHLLGYNKCQTRDHVAMLSHQPQFHDSHLTYEKTYKSHYLQYYYMNY